MINRAYVSLNSSLIIQLLVLCLFLIIPNKSKGENYPYRNDFLWTTVPDHADWLYKVGEKANVEVSLYRYGIPVDAEINYELADDMLEADAKGKTRLKNGRATIALGTKKTPGFRDLRMTVKYDGQTTTHHVKVGFSVDKIKSATEEPSDFQDYWTNKISRLRQQPLKVTEEEAPEYTTDKMTCKLLRVSVDKQHTVYAYLFMPRQANAQGFPAVLCPPGAGIKTIKEPLRHRYYGEGGCIRMEMEIHGLDPRLSSETFTEMSRAFNPSSPGGYLSYGLNDRDQYYMSHVYLALVRCLDYLTSLSEWDGKNLIVQGGSQGGALSIVAAALDNRVTQCVVNHPALSDMGAYVLSESCGGYPHFKHLDTKELETLSYYDVVNFARHLQAQVYMTWGYNDNTCPPTTSYAVWNTLQCPKEALLTPINEHWTSDTTERQQYEWIMSHLKK